MAITPYHHILKHIHFTTSSRTLPTQSSQICAYTCNTLWFP